MSTNSRIKAFLAYLFLAVGGIVVLLVSRKDRFAVFHARQSIILTIVAVLAPAIWLLCAYVATLIPTVGAVIAMASFTFVIAVYLALIVAWISGMVYALRAEWKQTPFFGGMASRQR